MERGIDISHWNGRADWLALKEVDGVRFMWAKITEGDYFYDQHFDYYTIGAGREGIARGAYHFFRWNVAPELQLKTIRDAWPGDLELGLAIDVERHPKDPSRLSTVQKIALRQNLSWLINAWAQLVGKPPTIYTGYYYWQDNIGPMLGFAVCPLWIASYRAVPLIPAPWTDYTYWQYTSSGKLFGMDKSIDLDWRK